MLNRKQIEQLRPGDIIYRVNEYSFVDKLTIKSKPAKFDAVGYYCKLENSVHIKDSYLSSRFNTYFLSREEAEIHLRVNMQEELDRLSDPKVLLNELFTRVKEHLAFSQEVIYKKAIDNYIELHRED